MYYSIMRPYSIGCSCSSYLYVVRIDFTCPSLSHNTACHDLEYGSNNYPYFIRKLIWQNYSKLVMYKILYYVSVFAEGM